jgi:uncharacterized BrkB/YihY/UPF0761 family membrane protein
VNLIERGVRRVDRVQQRSRAGGLGFAVLKKFGDDDGPALAASLTYYGFMSIFPLLLIITTVVGFIGNARVEDTVVGGALAQLPVFGEQLGRNVAHPLTGSWFALAFGLVWLLYGAMGVAQSAQHAIAQIWNVPGVVRPGFASRLLRGLAFFVTVGVGAGLAAALVGVGTASGHTWSTRALVLLADLLLNVALYLAAFRVLTPHAATTDLVPGAIAAGIGYTVLIATGTALIQHQLRHAEVVYGQFALVLGLISWLFLVSRLTLYATEFNVVRSRHLWPRSIVQPPLTEADQRVLGDIVRQEERRPEQRVGVSFDPDVSRADG